jgi:hypothetical protein
MRGRSMVPAADVDRAIQTEFEKRRSLHDVHSKDCCVD